MEPALLHEAPIEISMSAMARIRQIMSQEGHEPEGSRLRISVVSGGCSGLSYKLEFEDDRGFSSPDGLFEGNSVAKTGEQRFEIDGLRIAIDMRSVLYLAGTRLEFSEGLQGKGFHFENPNASRTCSCGESFSL